MKIYLFSSTLPDKYRIVVLPLSRPQPLFYIILSSSLHIIELFPSLRLDFRVPKTSLNEKAVLLYSLFMCETRLGLKMFTVSIINSLKFSQY